MNTMRASLLAGIGIAQFILTLGDARADAWETQMADRLSQAHLGAKVLSVSTLKQGYSGATTARVHLDDGRDVVVKMVLNWEQIENPSEYRRELVRAQEAARQGLGPDVLFSDILAGTLVTTFLPDEMGAWEDGGQEPKLSATLKTMRALHQSEPPSCVKKYDDSAARRSWDHERASLSSEDAARPSIALAHEVAAASIAQLATLCYAATPLHNDLHQHNVRYTEGRAWLIDWGTAGYGDPMQELAYYLYHIDVPLDKALAYAVGYGKISKTESIRVQLHLTLLHAHHYVLTLKGMPWDRPQWRESKLQMHVDYLTQDLTWLRLLSDVQG